jgi:hypothetical protein
MAHTFEIDIEHGILRESFVGVLDFKALKDADTAITADPGFQKGFNFLTDLRTAEITIGYQEMASHASSLSDLGVKKQAFIVNSELEFGIARMFTLLSEGKGHFVESHVFVNLDEASEWLNS